MDIENLEGRVRVFQGTPLAERQGFTTVEWKLIQSPESELTQRLWSELSGLVALPLSSHIEELGKAGIEIIPPEKQQKGVYTAAYVTPDRRHCIVVPVPAYEGAWGHQQKLTSILGSEQSLFFAPIRYGDRGVLEIIPVGDTRMIEGAEKLSMERGWEGLHPEIVYSWRKIMDERPFDPYFSREGQIPFAQLVPDGRINEDYRHIESAQPYGSDTFRESISIAFHLQNGSIVLFSSADTADFKSS